MKTYFKYFLTVLKYLNIIVGAASLIMTIYSAKMWYEFAQTAKIHFSEISFYFLFKTFAVNLINAILLIISGIKLFKKQNSWLTLSKISWIIILIYFVWTLKNFLEQNNFKSSDWLGIIIIISIIFIIIISHFSKYLKSDNN